MTNPRIYMTRMAIFLVLAIAGAAVLMQPVYWGTKMPPIPRKCCGQPPSCPFTPEPIVPLLL